MDKYIDYYFNILVSLDNIDDVREMLPNINLDKTNQILDMVIKKINEEIVVARELEDEKYLLYLNDVIDLLNSRKVEEIEEESFFNENIVIFSSNILKTIRKLNDSFFYLECVSAINSLKSKEWMDSNKNNVQNYKRLHGDASGLSEIKMKKIRLMHMPITPDIWYVSDILKKDANNSKQHRIYLHSLANSTREDIERIKCMFSVDGKLDIEALKKYASLSSVEIYEELSRFGGKRL